VGTGTMGAMALWRLANAGARVVGFEQFDLGHGRSAAGHESRLFRDAPSVAYGESPAYVPILHRAYDLWRELESASGQQLLTLTGMLLIGTVDGDSMHRITTSARELGRPHEVLDRDEMARRYPQHRLRPGEIAVLDRHAGVLRSDRSVVAAATCAQELGATVVQGVPITAVEPDADGVVVRTPQQSYQVAQAVICAGPWTARLLPQLEPFLTPRRSVVTWYAPREPDAYTPTRFPAFTRNSPGIHVYGVPSLDRRTVKVAQHATYELDDPDQLADRVASDELAPINAAVAELLPGLSPTPVRTATCMDTFTPDGQPLVGAVPGAPHLWVAAGFSGHGFKMAAAVGEIMAELVMTGCTELPIAHVDPARYTPESS
jgi:sarcosine oxidase